MVRRIDWGPIETIEDAHRQRRLLWVLCFGCGHVEKFQPLNLMSFAGAISLHDLRKRMRCRRCHARRAHIVPHDEPWRGRD